MTENGLFLLAVDKSTRTRNGVCKALGKEGVERKLCKELEVRGEESLNNIRDEAKEVAESLGNSQ